jgi:hypothetical protein
MYRKTGADSGFADETPKQCASVTPPFAPDYDPGAPFCDCLFRDAAPSYLKPKLAGIAHKRNF